MSKNDHEGDILVNGEVVVPMKKTKLVCNLDWQKIAKAKKTVSVREQLLFALEPTEQDTQDKR